MIALYLAPVFIGILVLEFVRQVKYFKKHPSYKAFKIVVLVIILFVFSLSIPAAFLLPNGILKRIVSKFANYYLGILLYLFLGIAIADILRFIYKLISRKKYSEKWGHSLSNIFVVVFTITMSVYGIINAHNLHMTYYDISSSKKSAVDNLNIVLISDIHLGYNMGEKEIINMVKKINDTNPDIVVLAGDIFDNEYDAIEKPEKIEELFRSIKTKYGKFAVYGNHDIEEKIFCGFTFSWKTGEASKASDKMNEFMKNTGFTLLSDQGVSLRNEKGKAIANIYGRPDAVKTNFGKTERLKAKDITRGFDSNNYFICIDHQPSELEELADAGVDLDLCGHTHNGQIWPGTITIKMLWDNAYGLLKVKDMINIVTSGVGLFGVNMRTGCIAEIVQINVSLNN